MEPGPRARRLTGPLLFLAVLGIFLPVVRNGFVSFDDPAYVTGNPHVLGGLTWPGIRWAFGAFYASNWHPLTWISHMADCQIYGLEPWGPHLTNALLHAASTLLLYLVLRKMTGSAGCSLFAAALFGLHPLRVESVAWVAERKDVLSGLFWMLTLWAYAEWVQGRAENPSSPGEAATRSGNGSWFFYGLALGFFILGLMSKAMVVTLPFVLLLLDYWPLGRMGGSGRIEGNSPHLKAAVRLVVEKIPFFAAAGLAAAITFIAQRRGGGMPDLVRLPWPDRIENAVVSYWLYLGKIIYPAHLSVFYPLPGTFPLGLCLGAAVPLAGATFFLAALRRKHPYLIVGWLWYLGTLVPVLGLVQVGSQSMADRYTYLPSIGIFVMAAWGAARLTAGWRRRTVVLGAAALLAALALLTERQISYWRDSETLFRHALSATSDNWLAQNNVGVISLNQGRTAEARSLLEEGARLRPENAEIHNNLGSVLAATGELEAARTQYEEALRLRPDYAEARNGLGNLLIKAGEPGEAIAEYEEALRLKPDFPDFRQNLAVAHFNLANVLAAADRVPEAIAHYRTALRLDDQWAELHNNLGNALVRADRSGDAIAEFEEALQLKPGYFQAHFNLGNALANAGRLPEAIAHYEAALRLNPSYVRGHNNLGIALEAAGRLPQARAEFEEALRLDPGYAAARRNLERARAAAGQ